MMVRLDARIPGARDRAGTLESIGRDSAAPIGQGPKQRFVVGVKTNEIRLAAKAQKAGRA
jgi:hypothetical protein